MGRVWTIDRSPSDASIRALEREVFERVFGYLAAPGVKVPRFTEDHEMTEAVISHIQDAWKPQDFRVWRRIDADAGCAVEAMIRIGAEGGYSGSGPTRGVAVCRAALFLAPSWARKWERPE
jgi:hypothetical protein